MSAAQCKNGETKAKNTEKKEEEAPFKMQNTAATDAAFRYNNPPAPTHPPNPPPRRVLKGGADAWKPNLFPFLRSISLSLRLGDKDTEASCKTQLLTRSPRHASHREGHIHLSDGLTDSSKGRRADTGKGTVNTSAAVSISGRGLF